MTPVINARNKWLVGVLVGLAIVAAIGFAPLDFRAYGIAIEIYVLAGAAVSWNIIGGYAGQLSLGHAASFGLGAYTAAWLTYAYSSPLWVSVPAAMAVSCVISVVLVPCFRARGAYFAILTLAFAVILGELARQYAPNGNSGLLFSSFPGISRAPLHLLTIGLLVSLVLVAVMTRSSFGKALKAIRLDLDGARAVGVDDMRMRTAALLLGSALNGFFGGVYALNLGYIDPATAFNLDWSILPLLAAILGGTATIFGPVAGAAVWIGLSETITALGLTGGAPLILQGAALVLTVLLLPNGLAGVASSVRRRLIRARGTRRTAARVSDAGPSPANLAQTTTQSDMNHSTTADHGRGDTRV